MQVYTYLYIYIVPDGISLQQLALQIKKKKLVGGESNSNIKMDKTAIIIG